MRVLYERGSYRVVEYPDEFCSMEDLKGDLFSEKCNPDIPVERLKEEEKHFEDLVDREGCFGYVLEVWNSEVGKGWENVDSCWGFVGSYSEEETFRHYIVDELISSIPES